MITNRVGPVGYHEKATEFAIRPRAGAKNPRIHSGIVVIGWAVSALGINYDDGTGSAPYPVQGMAPAPGRNVFEVPRGDSLVTIKVGGTRRLPATRQMRSSRCSWGPQAGSSRRCTVVRAAARR